MTFGFRRRWSKSWQQLGVHVTTVRRWLRTKKIPEATYVLLDLLHNGSIERIHPAWSGWSIDTRSGDLESPVGTRIRAGEILAIPLRRHQVSALECDVRELKKQLASRDRDKGESVKNDGGDAGDR